MIMYNYHNLTYPYDFGGRNYVIGVLAMWDHRYDLGFFFPCIAWVEVEMELGYDDLVLPYNLEFFPVVPATVVIYFVVIGVLRFFMKDRPPMEVNVLLAIHNFILCAFSFICFFGQFYEAFLIYKNFGVYAMYCGSFDDDWDLRMAQWGIAFYLSKYYELFDTVFLVVRKKPMTLLHLFHHSIVVPISWMAVYSRIYMGWITAFNNTGVHIIMYFYFAIYALGYRPWWKKYLTSLQIFQFVVDMSSSIPFIVIYYLGYPCRGELYAWIIANLTGVALLLLFMNFYSTTYRPPTKPGQKATKSS